MKTHCRTPSSLSHTHTDQASAGPPRPQGRDTPEGVDYVNYRAELVRARKRLDVATDVRLAAIKSYEEGLWRAMMALHHRPYLSPPAPPLALPTSLDDHDDDRQS